MAGESWLGGQITGERPSRGTTGGGYVPLGDVPNAPKTVDMPMIGNYPAMFTQKVEYQKGPPDMKGRAADLMQPDLPSSFEQAGNIRTEAAGKGLMAVAEAKAAMGKAISGAGEDISQSLGSAGWVLSKVAGKAREAVVDKGTEDFKTLSNTYQQEVDLAIRTLPPDEQGAAIKAATDKYDKGRAALAESVGKLDKLAGDKIESSGQAVRDTALNYTVPLHQNLKVIENTNEMWRNKLVNSRETGDWAAADEAIAGLEKTGAYSGDMVKVEQEKNKDLQGRESVNLAISLNPRMVEAETKKVMEGGTSKELPWLNKHNAPTVHVEARGQANLKETEALNDLSLMIADGRLSDPKEIRSLGEARGLDSGDLLKLTAYSKSFKKDQETNMALVPARLVEARQRIAKYDYANDPTLERYKADLDFINANIPPDERAPLIKALHDKSEGSMKQKSPDQIARAREVDATKEEVVTLGKKGMFLEDSAKRELFRQAAKKISEGKKDLTQEELAVWREGNALTDAHLNAVDAQVNKEPDFAPGDLHKKAFEKLSPEIQKSVTNYSGGAPSPRGQLNNSILIPTKEQLQAASALPPNEWLATGAREPNKATPSYAAALAGPGQTFSNVRFTAFTPGKNKIRMEGKNEVATRGGGSFTVEGYLRGTFPWATAAVDQKSKLAGQYFVTDAHPNIVMKGEDTGDAFIGAGESHIDLSFEDPQKAGNYEITAGNVKIISEAQAMEISGAQRRGTASTASGGSANLVASIDRKSTSSSGVPMTSGILNVGGTPFRYNSGGGGRGNLPPGEYVVTEHMPTRNTPGMVVGTVGFSFALSDKFDPRVGGTRTLLRIHPDGGTAGTAGCIGIVGGPQQQLAFRDYLTAEIRRNGGKAILKVG